MIGWTIAEWREAYRRGASPHDLLAALVQALPVADPAWISLIDPHDLAAAVAPLEGRDGAADRPLYGIPFAVKDNIDAAGFATTAACPQFAYRPTRDATAVRRLVNAGAVVIGKTNLDQFATGLVGTRSPYGTVPNNFDPRFIGGGSSSGSAAVVARGWVPFALGTDTAGSGRVPAGFNNIVGLKPTRGSIGAAGIVPACRTLDCVSIMATTVADAAMVYEIVRGTDPQDAYSRPAPLDSPSRRLPQRPRLGIPARPEFFGDRAMQIAYDAALRRLEAQGAMLVPLEFDVLDRVAALLYDGPWVAERLAAIAEFAAGHADEMNPVVREVIFAAHRFSAADAFRGIYRLAALKREADALIASVDALLVPTAPRHFRLDEVAADPIGSNSRLGRYTNFVNLLDWSALALPAGFRDDGLPFGLTLIGRPWDEWALAEYTARLETAWALPRGATGLPQPSAVPAAVEPSPAAEPADRRVRLAVVGAHLSGMPLNEQLTRRDAVFVERTTTSAAYRLYALPDTRPPKPGLARTDRGSPIEVELWDVPLSAFGSFVAEIPPPLGIGTIELADGRQVKSFICEGWALRGAADITSFGGWRAYLSRHG